MIAVFAFLSYTYFSQAQIPNFVNYQGRLRDAGGNPIVVPTTIQFSLYNHITNGAPSDVPSQAGDLLWTETYDGSGGCTQITPGDDGIFAQHLGTCVSFPDYLDFTEEYYLGVKIGGDAEATPRIPLATNPYAFTSKQLYTDGEDIKITTVTTGDIILRAVDDILMYDTNDELGLPGQVLSSTANGIDWVNATTTPWDNDHDTGMQVEETADDDTIRFDTFGTQRAKIDNIGNVLFSNLDPADLLNPGALTGLLFRNDKRALRIGEAGSNEWDDANIGTGSFSTGQNNIVSGWYSSALGGNNNINDSYSTAMGRNNTVTSSYSVTGGFQNTNSSRAGMVFGQTNAVSDNMAAAWGLDNIASEREATAWGRNTEANAPYATSWGRDTIASGEHSTVFGYRNTASNDYGLAFGFQNDASGRYATVWGGQNTASGQYSTAWGSHNTASGAHSTAIGYYSTASAENGTAIGDSLANSNYMTAIGRFNENVAGQNLTTWVDTDQLFVIGNGSGWQDANRSNAFTILKNGTITAPTFSIAEINTAGNTALTTKEYVDGAILAGGGNIYTADGTINNDRIVTISDDNILEFSGGSNAEIILESESSSLFVENDQVAISVGNVINSIISISEGDTLITARDNTTNRLTEFNARTNGMDMYYIGDTNNHSIRSGLQIGNDMIFYDSLHSKGVVYADDYSANYTNRSLVDKEYVDEQLQWEIIGDRIQPKNNSVRQIYVEEDSNSYTQFMVRNNNDVGNGAGAIIELKGSGPDYSNNMYIGKYGGNFWIPELRDNGAVLTDKNLVIGTASNAHEIHFVTGDSYTNLLPVVVADNEGFRYTSDLSGTYADRTLVDKGYVDNAVTAGVTASNGLTKLGPDIRLGGNLNNHTVINKNDNAVVFNGIGGFTARYGDTSYPMIDIGFHSFTLGYHTPSDDVNLGVSMGGNMTMTDTRHTTGIVYADNYSANYTNRSLVDKEYVDGLLAGGNNIYSADGTLTGSRTATMNTNNLQFDSTGQNGLFTIDATNDQIGIGTSIPDYTLDVAGEVGVDRHIFHNGDSNTYMDFTDDRIRFYAGGRSMIDMQQDNNDMVFNEGNTQTDFRFEGGTDENLLFLDGSEDMIGIGIAVPSDKLHVNGDLRVVGHYKDSNNEIGTPGQVLSATATGTDWIDVGGGSSIFELHSSVSEEVVRNVGDHSVEDFVFGSPQLNDDGDTDHDKRMLFDKSKGAFRVGAVDGTQWNEGNVGDYSVAFGSNTTSSAFASSAFGYDTTASSDMSVAFGHGTTASGAFSNAFGVSSTASGAYSIAMGHNLTAASGHEIVFGRNEELYTPDWTAGWDVDDRLFVIGNGATSGSRSNALTIMKNGMMGVGTSSPSYKLEVSGALMLEDMTAPTASAGHSGLYSAGGELYALDASGNSTNISPHNKDGLWQYDSENLETGKTLTVEMELLTKELNKVLGGGFITENGETIDEGVNIISNLSLKTNENINTISELKDSLDNNLKIIENSLEELELNIKADSQTEQTEQIQSNTENIKTNTTNLSTLSKNINSLTELTTTLTESIEDHETRIANIESILSEEEINLDLDNTNNSVELPEVLTTFSNNIEVLEEEGKDVKFTLDGKLVVKEISTEKITTDELVVKSSTVGTAIIEEGKTKVKVKTKAINKNSHIILTPHGAVIVGLAKIEEGEGFTVEINEELNNDLKIEWFIVQEQE